MRSQLKLVLSKIKTLKKKCSTGFWAALFVSLLCALSITGHGWSNGSNKSGKHGAAATEIQIRWTKTSGVLMKLSSDDEALRHSGSYWWEPRPTADAEDRADWELKDQLALDKLKYSVSDSIHAIVWKGQENLTAKDYYDTMNTLLLKTTTRSIVQLEKCLNSCRMRDNVDFWNGCVQWTTCMANLHR